MYAVETIRSSEKLEDLAPEWADLCRIDPRATPFQTPEWNLGWWRAFGHGTLCGVAVRHDGALVGLAPLFVSRRSLFPLRRLAHLGTGKSDYLDLLAHPAHRVEVTQRVWRTLREARAKWDVLDLQQAPPEANVLDFASADAKTVTAYPHSACPFVPLAGDEGMEHVPAGFRKNLRYSRRRLVRTGHVRFRLATPATLGRDLDELFRLHHSRWRSRGLPGVFGGDRVRSFHREASAAFLEGGILRLHLLELDGQVLAAALCYAMKCRTFYYGGGFDPALAAYSPGSLVIEEAIRRAAGEGCSEFDFLRGEEPYKRLWGCRARRNQRLIAATNPVAGKVSRWLPGVEATLEREGLRALARYQAWRR